VNRISPAADLDRETAELALKLASKSRLTLALGKRSFHEQLALPLQAAYEAANQRMAENMAAEDAREGIGAFLQKRPPEWRDR
jgi:enoyl-CoA hydratase/carnithine racemase